MEWYEWYGPDRVPTLGDISAFVGSGLWEQARDGLETGFHTAPRLTYSTCSMQKGWNVKYKKGGRALCTLYPMAGYFLALVVIGRREEAGMHTVLDGLSGDTQALYRRTPFSMGGRWLTLKVDREAALDDLMKLMKLRAAS